MMRVLSFRMRLEELWQSWAQENHVQLVIIQPTSEKEMLEIVQKYDRIDAIANTVAGSKLMGGYTETIMAAVASKGCRAVCHRGAGYDSVGSVEKWSHVGVQIANAPNSVARSTADHALWLLLGSMRLSQYYTSTLRAGDWNGTQPLGHDPEGTTLGILGMGNIGRMIRDRCRPFGFKEVIYHSRHRLDPEMEQESRYVRDISEFLQQSSALVVVAPLNALTMHILNKDRLKLLPEGASVVNIGRGPLIDECALAELLAAGKLASVGLDVYENEPKVHPQLLKSNRALLTPHMGTSTYETRDALDREVLENVDSVLRTGRVKSRV